MVSSVDVNAVGLGTDILYQSYFVCITEASTFTLIEYGKSQASTEYGDVYLTLLDIDDPLSVQFYLFGNGEEPMKVVDAHILSRHLTKVHCKGDTKFDNQTNMCVQDCHALCDPLRGKKIFFVNRLVIESIEISTSLKPPVNMLKVDEKFKIY